MPETLYTPTSAWEVYASKKSAMQTFAEEYKAFLSACKTERETIQFCQAALQGAGFSQNFATASAGKMYHILHGKALFAIRKGKKNMAEGVRLIAAHADTPRLDLKQHPFLEQTQFVQAKTHYYGGIRKYQWLARPLALHGVVVKQDGKSIPLILGEEDPVFTIADLLPHLAQKQNAQTVSDAFEAEKLNILFGHEPVASKKGKKDADAPKDPVKAHLLEILHTRYNIIEEDLFSAELQIVPSGPAHFVGLDSALIGGYGHDDRACVYTALTAFLEAEKPEHTTALILWDKEETGSESTTGASGRFLEYCMEEAAENLAPQTPLRNIWLKTKALSGDVHAPIDPDFQELHEKQNAASMGFGPVFSKFTGSRGKYGANDAHAEYVAFLRHLFNNHKVPWQMAELGKVDQGGGGTVALYLAAYGMDVIDLGPCVLSMHSPFELLSVPDLFATKEAYTTFYKKA